MILTLLSMAWSSELAALVWLAVALIAAIVEVSIPHFGFGFVSIGAVAAAGLAFVGSSVTVQMAVFVAVLSISLLLRSRLLGRLMSGRGLPSRTDVMIGRHGVVTHDIDATLGGGRVNVGGEDWAARSSDVIGSGTKVRVVGADGIVLEVTRA
jgi:membrane protein implicated in regulation of membrane protease activity